MKTYSSNVSSGEEYFHREYFTATLRTRAVKGAGATLIATFSTFAIQMVSVVVLSRLLTPDDFGLVAMVTSVYSVFRVLRNFGLTDATIQEKELNHRKVSTLFWINCAFGVLLTLAFMGFGPLIAWFYKEPRITYIAILISLDSLFGGMATQHRALLKRNFEFNKNTAIEVPSALAGFGTAILLAWNGWGYWAIVSRWVVAAVLEFVLAWSLCPWRPGLPAYGTGVRPMMKFGMHMIGNLSVRYFANNFDKILVGRRFGSFSLGFYDRAYQLFMAPTQRLSEPLTHVAVATLSKLREEPETLRRYYISAISILSFVGFPISAMLTVMSEDMVLLLLGPQWGKAADIFSVFGLAIGVQMIYGTTSWLHISLGRPDRWFRWNTAGSIITMLSFFAGLPFGPKGVVIAYTTTLFLLIGPSLWYAGRPVKLKLSSVLRETWRFFAASVLTGGVYRYVFHSMEVPAGFLGGMGLVSRVFFSLCFCTVVYLLTVIALHGGIGPMRQMALVARDLLPGRDEGLTFPTESGMRKLAAALFAVLMVRFIGGPKGVVATANLSTCDQSTVNSAIASAADGDTLVCPAGSWSWSDVNINNKNITLKGAGIGKTVISITAAGGIEASAGNTKPFRITGFTFKSTANFGTDSGFAMMRILGGQGWRVDNNEFQVYSDVESCNGGNALYTKNKVGGLIDHNRFVKDTASSGCVHAYVYPEGMGAAAWGMASQIQKPDYTVFVEDNYFHQPDSCTAHNAHAISGQTGGIFVFRHNEVHNLNVDTHGFCAAVGTREWEVSNNKFYTDRGNSLYRLFQLRGGTGVVYNNSLVSNGPTKYGIGLNDYRVSTSQCDGATQDGISSSSRCGEGYPCIDQIGRGQNQSSDPAYFWNNTGFPGMSNEAPDYIKASRDYYTSGPKPGYTAYTYPHPLAEGSTGGPPWGSPGGSVDTRSGCGGIF